MQILGFLGKSLGKIPTKKSKNIQDSYQEFQEFLQLTVVFAIVEIEEIIGKKNLQMRENITEERNLNFNGLLLEFLRYVFCQNHVEGRNAEKARTLVAENGQFLTNINQWHKMVMDIEVHTVPVVRV